MTTPIRLGIAISSRLRIMLSMASCPCIADCSQPIERGDSAAYRHLPDARVTAVHVAHHPLTSAR